MTVASGVWSPMRSSRESSRSACSSTSSGISGLGDLRPVLLDDGRLVLAELLADRVELAAQDVLALLLLDPGLDVLLDAPAHLHERQALALHLERELEALADVDRLEELDLLLEGQVGRVAGGVGERAGLADRAHEGGDAAVVAAQLEDLLDDRAVLALELADPPVDGLVVRALLDLDEEPALAVGRRPRRRCRGAGPASATARPPPGSRMRSVTSATVPTFAYSSSCLGTSSTRSSSPTSTVRVTFMLGKTTRSSRGTSSRRSFGSCSTSLAFVRRSVVSSKSVATRSGAAGPRSAAKAAKAPERDRRDRGRRAGPRTGRRRLVPRHDARDEDAAAPEDEAGVVPRVRRSSPPCAGRRRRRARAGSRRASASRARARAARAGSGRRRR